MPDAWYESAPAGAPLLQGEFVLSCPTLILPEDLASLQPGQKVSVGVQTYNAVIMTQSCDLSSKGVDTVLLCPYYPFKEWIQNTKGYRDQASKDVSNRTTEVLHNLVASELKGLAGGRRVAYHLLDRDEQVGFTDYQVVELNEAFSVRRNIVEQLVERQQIRNRLKSPYIEHLSQAYATVFMRVGLPKNVSEIADAAYYNPSAEYRAEAKAEAQAKAEEKARALASDAAQG